MVESVVEQIADAIRSGELRVGDRLPAERPLAATFDVSRPTLREALGILAASGVVEVVPGPRGGTFVRSDAVPHDLAGTAPTLRIAEVADVLLARRLLEPQVAQLAALHATPDNFDAMRRTIDDQRRSLRNRPRFLQLDHRFHLELARATRNTLVVTLMRLMLRHLAVAQEMAVRGPHEPERAIELHEQTLRALMTRDPDRISEAMDAHLSYLEDIWEEETGRARVQRLPPFLLPATAQRRETAT